MSSSFARTLKKRHTPMSSLLTPKKGLSVPVPLLPILATIAPSTIQSVYSSDRQLALCCRSTLIVRAGTVEMLKPTSYTAAEKKGHRVLECHQLMHNLVMPQDAHHTPPSAPAYSTPTSHPSLPSSRPARPFTYQSVIYRS